MNRKLASLAVAVVAAIAAPAALAQSAGSWTVGIGVHNVDPKSDNGTLDASAFKLGKLPMQIGSSARPTVTGEYFLQDNLGIEVIAALPFSHDINVKGVGQVGSTKHLPPTVSLQYHFGATDAAVKPFIGAGVNYTAFFGEKTTGPIAGTRLDLSNSFGLALHAGIDFRIGNGALRIDARKIDIDTDVKVNNVGIGTVNIDPIVYGASYVMKF